MVTVNGTNKKVFKFKPRDLVITFGEGSPYEGAEVTCSTRLTIEEILNVREAFAALSGESEAGNESLGEAIQFFGDHVVKGWNLCEDDGEPIPISGENVKQLPFDFVTQLVAQWTAVAFGAPRPLSVESSDGPLLEKDTSLLN